MFTWAKIPFVRITLLFIVGISLGLRFPDYPLLGATLLLTSAVLLIILRFQKAGFMLKFNPVYGLTISAVFVLFGYLTVWLQSNLNQKNNLAHFSKIEAYQVEVRATPEKKNKSLKILGRVEAVRQDTTWHQADGEVLVYLERSIKQPEFGDRLLILGTPRPITGPRNPHEFNYKQYLANKGIFHSHWVDSTAWQIIGRAEGFDVLRLASQTRTYLEGLIELTIVSSKAAGVLKALVLGNKEDLDPVTREIFARAGVMHVLAVSGLHVGIIYLILIILLKPVSSRMSSPWLESLVIILILWLYAFVTGLPPSVLRAVTMFSILELGRRLGKSASPFNSLALSAFILLWFNPLLITQVGFQLSYIAVTGILLLYSPIQDLYQPANRLVRFFWQIIAVSIAAQVATAPLAIFYFSQFPTYFLVANLLVIPTVTVLVWGGVMLLLLALISLSLASLLGHFLELAVQLLEFFLAKLTELPFATIQNISFDSIDLLLVYSFLALLSAIIITKVRPILKYGLLIITFLFLGRSVWLTFEQYDRHEIIFYSLSSGQWAVDLIQEGEYITVADASLEAEKVSYSIQPNRLRSNLAPSAVPLASAPLQDAGQLIVWQGKKILIAEACVHDLPELEQFDFVLQANHPRFKECYSDQNLLIKLVNDKFLGHDLQNQAYVAPL